MRHFVFATLLWMIAAPLWAQNFATPARSAFVIDVSSGTVLLAKNTDAPLPPASMSKLMTLNMLFEALVDGRVSLSDTWRVSQRAQDMGGSSMYLDKRDRPTTEELIQGIIVQSGNDACVVVAEGLAGGEEEFAQLMTERARSVGMNNSTFGNASGWPHPLQKMSTHDLGTLAVRLITEFPQFYPYFSQKSFAFDGRVPDNHRNRNPLLALGIGADGLKTGHTNEAGYGLVGSAVQGKRRVVFVVSGLDSANLRATESERITNWALRQFIQKTIATPDDIITDAPVWMGEVTKVALVPATPIELLLPVVGSDKLNAIVEYHGPIQAPVSAGQELGRLVIKREGLTDQSFPLVAKDAVQSGGFMTRITTGAAKLKQQYWASEPDPAS